MWIETGKDRRACNKGRYSFASNGECGLKQGTEHGAGCPRTDSFASNGECGLKPAGRKQRRRVGDSFASNGECGLKRLCEKAHDLCAGGFIRQQWRMWIETMMVNAQAKRNVDSFASNGECGLKLPPPEPVDVVKIFIRQQWRMWIETARTWWPMRSQLRFIRQQWRMWIETDVMCSVAWRSHIHSPAMANVD